MREELVAQIMEMTEPELAVFQKRVISDTAYPILGVRVPKLRKLAKSAARDDWRKLLREAQYESFEEILLVGLTVGYARGSLCDRLDAIRVLLPRMDSWGLTDSIAATLKIQPSERDEAWRFAMECLVDPMEYTVRFGILVLLDYFLTSETIPDVANQLTKIVDTRYYVRMAVAWCFAEMAVHDMERVFNVLKSGTLDCFTHNMTIRKMRESHRITHEQKAVALSLKRKEDKL